MVARLGVSVAQIPLHNRTFSPHDFSNGIKNGKLRLETSLYFGSPCRSGHMTYFETEIRCLPVISSTVRVGVPFVPDLGLRALAAGVFKYVICTGASYEPRGPGMCGRNPEWFTLCVRVSYLLMVPSAHSLPVSMLDCAGCGRNFTIPGYTHHIYATSNPSCLTAHQDELKAMEAAFQMADASEVEVQPFPISSGPLDEDMDYVGHARQSDEDTREVDDSDGGASSGDESEGTTDDDDDNGDSDVNSDEESDEGQEDSDDNDDVAIPDHLFQLQPPPDDEEIADVEAQVPVPYGVDHEEVDVDSDSEPVHTGAGDRCELQVQEAQSDNTHKLEIEKYPSISAGAPLAATGSESLTTNFGTRAGNVYAPFISRIDWVIARWTKTHSIPFNATYE